MNEVIYSRTYPKNGPDEPKKRKDKPFLLIESERRRRVSEKTDFREIRGRREGQLRFIDTAICLCDDHKYSLELHQTDFETWAILSLDWGSGLDVRLNELIGMADDVVFQQGEGGRDLTIVLTYCTIAICGDGQIITPDLLTQSFLNL